MLFNSFEYILLFLPIVFFVYFGLNKLRLIQLSKGWLVLASLFFYSYWKIDYLPLILFSMIFNYSIGSTLCNNENLKINKKLLLSFGVVCNIFLLAYFKYFDFILKNINAVFHSDFNYMKIVLPLAISFFTFQQIAYLVDSYKEETKEYDFLNYSLFVTFFPQLIAGPIVHHKEMMPQFANLRNKILCHKNISAGIFLFTIGLFKKVIIADGLSGFVHHGFDVVSSLNFVEGWLVSLSYTLQLYFDFSGYTDMALGSAMMFNIFLPLNFNSPYKASSIQDFWRRWHITLSRFLRDYIYIPLGGNRTSERKIYRNLITTFLIGGIWHGAAWTFVIWGALHGIALVIQKLWQKFKINVPKFVGIGLTFSFVNFCWVYFRATSFDSANKVLSAIIGLNGLGVTKIYHGNLRFDHLQEIELLDLSNPLYILILGLIVLFVKNSNQITARFKPSLFLAVLNCLVLGFILFNMNKVSEFLYFNF